MRGAKITEDGGGGGGRQQCTERGGGGGGGNKPTFLVWNAGEGPCTKYVYIHAHDETECCAHTSLGLSRTSFCHNT